jgi:hypothetical protein
LGALPPSSGGLPLFGDPFAHIAPAEIESLGLPRRTANNSTPTSKVARQVCLGDGLRTCSSLREKHRKFAIRIIDGGHGGVRSVYAPRAGEDGWTSLPPEGSGPLSYFPMNIWPAVPNVYRQRILMTPVANTR